MGRDSYGAGERAGGEETAPAGLYVRKGKNYAGKEYTVQDLFGRK